MFRFFRFVVRILSDFVVLCNKDVISFYGDWFTSSYRDFLFFNERIRVWGGAVEGF